MDDNTVLNNNTKASPCKTCSFQPLRVNILGQYKTLEASIAKLRELRVWLMLYQQLIGRANIAGKIALVLGISLAWLQINKFLVTSCL